MASDIVVYDQFEFRNNKLPLMADNRGRFVSFSRACQLIGLDVPSAWEQVQRRESLAAHTRIEFQATSGMAMYYMRAEALAAWFITLETAQIAPRFKALHTAFCNELVTAVYEYVTTGIAIKPGLSPLEVAERVASRLLEIDPSEQSKIVAASFLRSRLAIESGVNTKGEMPVTVASRIQERNLRMSQDEVIRIGQHVAAEYRRRTGREPSTFPQWINGRKTPVKSYTEADVNLIDGVIDRFRRKPR